MKLAIDDKKLRQVTDNIHDTIYMSELESTLCSSPFFYRLHDIYQSSTVYLTFPSNRTKRYEHSIGTMQVASQIFYYSIVNAEQSVVSGIFSNIYTYFLDSVIKQAVGISNDGSFPRHKSSLFLKLCSADGLNAVMQELAKQSEESIYKLLETEFYDANPSCIDDIALSHFIPHNLPTLQKIPAAFLYRCIFQAIRIVALYHDVGHPPYSHIIEEVLEGIVNSDGSLYSKEKYDFYNECISCDNKKIDLTDELTSASNRHIHERIGISMLSNAFSMYIKGKLPKLLLNGITYLNTTKDQRKNIRIKLMHIMGVIEFSFAIMCDKDNYFSSMHGIIDGIIDADRLDYVARDTRNSGIDWGEPPYKRLINSAKFALAQSSELVVSYPKKMADDIDDYLLLRYKLFIRINYHHRCVKTATVLRRVVFSLASLYMKSRFDSLGDLNHPLNDIRFLWSPLREFWTIERNAIEISRWHDSWLITLLYNTYIYLYGISEELTHGSEEWKSWENIFEDPESGSSLTTIMNYLEELLFNTKHYYSIIKRIGDENYITKNILDEAGISEGLLKEKIREIEEIIENKNSSGDEIDCLSNACKLLRILKKEYISPTFSVMSIVFGYNIAQMIQSALEIQKMNNVITDYIFEENKGRNSIGIPYDRVESEVNKYVWLYDSARPAFHYDDDSLRASLLAIKKSTVEWYVYVKLKESTDPKEQLRRIRASIAKEISSKIREKFVEIVKF